MTRTQHDFEPEHATSSTAHVLAELQLYGKLPATDALLNTSGLVQL